MILSYFLLLLTLSWTFGYVCTTSSQISDSSVTTILPLDSAYRDSNIELTLITFASEDIKAFSQYTIPVQQLYAQAWGLQYQCFDDASYSGNFDYYPTDRRWNKVGIIRHYIEQAKKSSNPPPSSGPRSLPLRKYVMWMDADLIPLNFTSLDPYSIVASAKGTSGERIDDGDGRGACGGVEVILSSEFHAESGVANTGCFLVRVHCSASSSVRDNESDIDSDSGASTASRSSVSSARGQYGGFSEYLLERWWRSFDRSAGHDQTFFSVLYKQLVREAQQCKSALEDGEVREGSCLSEYYSWPIESKIAILPHTALNSHPFPALHQQPQDAVLHLMGERGDVRQAIFRVAFEDAQRAYDRATAGTDGGVIRAAELTAEMSPQLGLNPGRLGEVWLTAMQAALDVEMMHMQQIVEEGGAVGDLLDDATVGRLLRSVTSVREIELLVDRFCGGVSEFLKPPGCSPTINGIEGSAEEAGAKDTMLHSDASSLSVMYDALRAAVDKMDPLSPLVGTVLHTCVVLGNDVLLQRQQLRNKIDANSMAKFDQKSLDITVELWLYLRKLSSFSKKLELDFQESVRLNNGGHDQAEEQHLKHLIKRTKHVEEMMSMHLTNVAMRMMPGEVAAPPSSHVLMRKVDLLLGAVDVIVHGFSDKLEQLDFVVTSSGARGQADPLASTEGILHELLHLSCGESFLDGLPGFSGRTDTGAEESQQSIYRLIEPLVALGQTLAALPITMDDISSAPLSNTKVVGDESLALLRLRASGSAVDPTYLSAVAFHVVLRVQSHLLRFETQLKQDHAAYVNTLLKALESYCISFDAHSRQIRQSVADSSSVGASKMLLRFQALLQVHANTLHRLNSFLIDHRLTFTNNTVGHEFAAFCRGESLATPQSGPTFSIEAAIVLNSQYAELYGANEREKLSQSTLKSHVRGVVSSLLRTLQEVDALAQNLLQLQDAEEMACFTGQMRRLAHGLLKTTGSILAPQREESVAQPDRGVREPAGDEGYEGVRVRTLVDSIAESLRSRGKEPADVDFLSIESRVTEVMHLTPLAVKKAYSSLNALIAEGVFNSKEQRKAFLGGYSEEFVQSYLFLEPIVSLASLLCTNALGNDRSSELHAIARILLQHALRAHQQQSELQKRLAELKIGSTSSLNRHIVSSFAYTLAISSECGYSEWLAIFNDRVNPVGSVDFSDPGSLDEIQVLHQLLKEYFLLSGTVKQHKKKFFSFDTTDAQPVSSDAKLAAYSMQVVDKLLHRLVFNACPMYRQDGRSISDAGAEGEEAIAEDSPVAMLRHVRAHCASLTKSSAKQ